MVFLLLVIYSLGRVWSTLLPKRSLVNGTRFEWLGPVLHIINPGKFRIKEVHLPHSYTYERLTKPSSPIFLACNCQYNRFERVIW